MRFLKNSFAALIAFFAITATIASYAGAFNGTELADPTPGCYRTIASAPPTLCGTNVVNLCATDANVGVPVDIESECNILIEDECCFIVTANPCASNPNGRIVTDVQCGEYQQAGK